MGAACLCACRQVVQLHRHWMAQTKASLGPLLEIHCSQEAARVLHQTEANELIHNVRCKAKTNRRNFTHLLLWSKEVLSQRVWKLLMGQCH